MIQSVFPWLQYITITTLVCQMILVSSADATDDILIDWCIDGKQELNQDDIFHLLVKKNGIDDNKINSILDNNSVWSTLHAQVQKIFTLLDTNADGILTCKEEIDTELSPETLRTLASVVTIGGDNHRANSDQFGYVKLTSQEIRMFLEDVISRLDDDKQTMSREDFITRYRLIGGSQDTGSELFNLMDQSHQGFITRHTVLSQMEDIIVLFDHHGTSHKERGEKATPGVNGDFIENNEVDANHKWNHEEL